MSLLNPWVLLGIVGALLGAYFYGHHAGAVGEKAAWEQREARINAETAGKIEAANKRVRDVEHAQAANLAAVDTVYQGKIKEKDHALTVALNSVRAGNRLFVNATCPPVDRNHASGVATGTGVGDGSPRAELSEPDSVFLLQIGSEADQVVEQLTACQGVVRADRVSR